MNTEPLKLTRLSLSGTEYQFEYIPTPIDLKRDTNGRHNAVTEYRIRRGGYGAWTRWFKTYDIGNTIRSFGFVKNPDGTIAATMLSDFTFEVLMGRGEIILNKPMVRMLSNNVGVNHTAAHLFSRLKSINPAHWILPSSAVVDKETYVYLKRVISEGMKSKTHGW